MRLQNRHDPPSSVMALSALNADFEAGVSDPPQHIWDEWLWGCNLAEPVSVDCLLNRAHLLGVLIARYRALREPGLTEVCVRLPHMVHQGTRVGLMTPRQLKDVIEDLQLHWAVYVETCDVDELTELVDACLTRFGAFNLKPSIYQDVGMRDAVHADRMGVLCIRRLISIMCVLYRHLDLLHRWVEPDSDVVAGVPAMESLQPFHVQSSMDEFHVHMMRSDLPPAALAIYKQDFAGFYHCVSQAVYFHFPDYERKAQLELDVLRGGMHPVHALASVREMYPEIHVCYEDENPTPGVWSWILMGARLYLLDARDGRVFYAPNIFRLMAVYLAEGTA
jgi:hypothetical protein